MTLRRCQYLTQTDTLPLKVPSVFMKIDFAPIALIVLFGALSTLIRENSK